jgi:two-component system sensor histidine kinase UhpB
VASAAAVDREGTRALRRRATELEQLTRRLEAEAKRQLARELHDTVAQVLTRMVVEMENFKLDLGGQEQVVERVGRLQESTREALAGIRQALYDLRREPTIEVDFVPGLHELVRRFSEVTGIRSGLSVAAGWPQQLSSVVAHHLFRVAEEALNNVRQHSGAAQVEVLLQALGDGLALTVHDDGRGLPWTGRAGMGLRGMRERVLLLGGSLEVSSPEGRGTTVRAVVPAKEGAR